MTIEPWRATCIQIESKLAATAQSPEEAWAIINANLQTAIDAIVAAAEGPLPPKLVVLPEFAFQGPPRATPVAEWIARACTSIPGKITDVLAPLAQKYNLFIAGNHFEVDSHWPDRYFNSSFVLDPKGEVILRYRRINTASWTSPHDFLDIYCETYGADALYPVADTEIGRLAIFPCGEISVPELSRMFMLRGAEVLIHPNNEPVNDISDAHKLCRAAENMCYLISANVGGLAGFSDELQGGRSQIVDFKGNRLAFEQSPAPSISCSALIDIEALQKARSDTAMSNGLMRSRFEMYRDIYAKSDIYPVNALAETPIKELSDLDGIHQTALANMRQLGILR